MKFAVEVCKCFKTVSEKKECLCGCRVGDGRRVVGSGEVLVAVDE